MLRTRIVLAALALVLPLAACTAGGIDEPEHSVGPSDPGDTQSDDADDSADDSEQTLTNDDPRCKLWSSPLLMLTLILHPVEDVAHFPPSALDATCRWEVAAGTNTIKYPHTYEALWLDVSDATFDQVTAAFEAEGATVVVDEILANSPVYGWVTVVAISSPDGSGELSLREPNHNFPARFITLTWTRA